MRSKTILHAAKFGAFIAPEYNGTLFDSALNATSAGSALAEQRRVMSKPPREDRCKSVSAGSMEPFKRTLWRVPYEA